ncbi:MAG: hypothetical protein ACR5LD_07345 [Symbiopectobacterium sp.]
MAQQPLLVKALSVLSHGIMTAMAAEKNKPADTVIYAAGLQNAMPDVVRYQRCHRKRRYRQCARSVVDFRTRVTELLIPDC